jgi:hypothetical protein
MDQFKALLMIMQPRRIPRALEAIAALRIDKVYLQGWWEKQLEPVIASIVRAGDHTHYILLADDTVPTQAALDLVLHHAAQGHPVVTGYCNNSVGSPNVNLTKRNFRNREKSTWEDYEWYTREEVESYPDALVPSRFTGACLTTMPRHMWQRFPFNAVTHAGEPRGYSSDWSLSVRLQGEMPTTGFSELGVGWPIVAPRGAFVEHLKEFDNSQKVTRPEQRLWVGDPSFPACAVWYDGGAQ